MPLAERDIPTSPWSRTWLHKALVHMRELDMHCPFVWITEAMCSSYQSDMDDDLLLLSPSKWSTIACMLVSVTRGVFLGTASVEEVKEQMDYCLQLLRDRREEPCCPLLRDYAASMQHVLDATWVVLTSVLLRIDVLAVDTLSKISVLEQMTPEAQSGVWALRTEIVRSFHYGIDPSFVEAKASSLYSYMECASRAYDLNKSEGYWRTLFGSALHKSDSRKPTLLESGYASCRAPCTAVEYATYLARSNRAAESVLFASLICETALRDWMDSLYVNTAYVLLFVRTACRKRLRRKVAVQCLSRALEFAPHSPLLLALAEDLGKFPKTFRMRCRGGTLPPIAEVEDELRDSGVFSSLDTSVEPISTEEDDEQEDDEQEDNVQEDDEQDEPVAQRMCNCVCSSACARYTFEAYGTLRPPVSTARLCLRNSC